MPSYQQKGQIANKAIAKDLKQSNQESVKSLSDKVDKFQMINGVLIKDIDLTATGKLVSHKLSRTYQGYIIIEKNADRAIWTDSSSFDKTKFLNLISSGAVKISIWVF